MRQGTNFKKGESGPRVAPSLDRERVRRARAAGAKSARVQTSCREVCSQNTGHIIQQRRRKISEKNKNAQRAKKKFFDE